MHDWWKLWPYARTWWGTFVAVLTFWAAVKPMFETYDYLMDRFVDYKVKDYLEANISYAGFTLPSGGRTQHSPAKSISAIATGVGMSERRVLGCLKRLKRKKAVRLAPGGWQLDIPPVTSL